MSPSRSPIRLRLLAPSIALIVAATMIPTGLRHPSFIHMSNGVAVGDVINNLILYMPLGFALAGSSFRRAFLCGLLLSTTAETLQLGYVDRIPSFLDIGCNTVGAVLGYVIAARWFRGRREEAQWLKIPRMFAIAAIPLAIAGTVMMLVHRPRADFSNWNPAARLVAGDEVTGGRPWAGTITALQIYPIAMTATQIDDVAHHAVTAGAQPQAFMPGGGLLAQSNFSAALGQPLLSHEGERALYDALVKSNRMTLLVLARPANLEQLGPARIITYSQGVFDRNFTLGQTRTGLTFRLRTPVTGSNGTDPALYTGSVLSTERSAFVAAVYDGRICSLYVDGKLAAHADFGLKRPHLPLRVVKRLPQPVPMRVIELAAVEMFCSSLLAIGLFAVWGVPQGRAPRLMVGVGAGLAVSAVIWLFVVSSPGLGIRIVLECVAAGVMIAASVQGEARTQADSPAVPQTLA